jgi:hypothetical protein
MFRLRYPASGFGPLVFSVVGGYRVPGEKPYRRPRAEGAAQGDEATAPPSAKTHAKSKDKQRFRSIGTVKKALDELLFNLATPPNIDGYFLLDEGPWPWVSWEEEDLFDGRSYRHWGLEGTPDLKAKVLHKLRDRLFYHYPEGWFFYRWFLSFVHGRPKLNLRLLGHLGPGVDVAHGMEYLPKAWLSITGSEDESLVTVEPPKEHALESFSVKPDSRTLPTLQRVLGGYIFGQFQKKNMPKVPMVEELITEEEWHRRREYLILHHLKHEGLLDEEGNPVALVEEKSPYYRKLMSDGNRAFLNRATGPQFLAGRGGAGH